MNDHDSDKFHLGPLCRNGHEYKDMWDLDEGLRTFEDVVDFVLEGLGDV